MKTITSILLAVLLLHAATCVEITNFVRYTSTTDEKTNNVRFDNLALNSGNKFVTGPFTENGTTSGLLMKFPSTGTNSFRTISVVDHTCSNFNAGFIANEYFVVFSCQEDETNDKKHKIVVLKTNSDLSTTITSEILTESNGMESNPKVMAAFGSNIALTYRNVNGDNTTWKVVILNSTFGHVSQFTLTSVTPTFIYQNSAGVTTLLGHSGLTVVVALEFSVSNTISASTFTLADTTDDDDSELKATYYDVLGDGTKVYTIIRVDGGDDDTTYITVSSAGEANFFRLTAGNSYSTSALGQLGSGYFVLGSNVLAKPVFGFPTALDAATLKDVDLTYSEYNAYYPQAVTTNGSNTIHLAGRFALDTSTDYGFFLDVSTADPAEADNRFASYLRDIKVDEGTGDKTVSYQATTPTSYGAYNAVAGYETTDTTTVQLSEKSSTLLTAQTDFSDDGDITSASHMFVALVTFFVAMFIGF